MLLLNVFSLLLMVFHPGLILGSLDFEEDIRYIPLDHESSALPHNHRTFHGGFCRLYTNTSQAWAPFCLRAFAHAGLSACGILFYLLHLGTQWLISVHILKEAFPKTHPFPCPYQPLVYLINLSLP